MGFGLTMNNNEEPTLRGSRRSGARWREQLNGRRGGALELGVYEELRGGQCGWTRPLSRGQMDPAQLPWGAHGDVSSGQIPNMFESYIRGSTQSLRERQGKKDPGILA